MNVNLLYPNRNHSDSEAYFDWNEIVKDLGLDVLFRAARKDRVENVGIVLLKAYGSVFVFNAVHAHASYGVFHYAHRLRVVDEFNALNLRHFDLFVICRHVILTHEMKYRNVRMSAPYRCTRRVYRNVSGTHDGDPLT